MLEIFNHKMQFNKEYYSFCFQNCIRQVLDFYGINGGEKYFDSSIDVEMLLDEKGFVDLKTFNKVEKDILLSGFENKLIRHSYDKDMSAETVWTINKNKIDEGIPVIAGVDLFYLDYQQYYMKNHSIHAIILCDYSEKEGSAKIIDWYEPWLYKGNVKIADFIKARSSNNPSDMGVFSGISINNSWSEIDCNGWDIHYEYLLLKTMELMLNKFYVGERYGEKTCHGINSLKKILVLFRTYEKSEWNDRANFLKQLHLIVFYLHKRFIFFSYYLSLYKFDMLSNLLSKNLKICEQLSLLTVCVQKCSIARTDQLYEKVKGMLKKIIDEMEDIYEDIYHILQILNV